MKHLFTTTLFLLLTHITKLPGCAPAGAAGKNGNGSGNGIGNSTPDGTPGD